MKNLALVTWSNTEYDDIWPAFFGRLERHLKFEKSYIFLNAQSDNVPEGHTQLINNENDPFYKRFLECLEQVEEDYILYFQEDHIFYDDVDHKKLEELLHYLEKSDLSFIRLLKSGELGGGLIDDNLYSIPLTSPYLFSQQSAIWKKDDLIRLTKMYKPNAYRDAELYGSVAMASMRMHGGYYYEGEKKRGSMHFDSRIFPYIATAVCKGQWNLKQYPRLLNEALEEYGIDSTIRGHYNG